jgi:TRAP-type C4-dicarboxylate transport system substrate-binding protein
MTQPRKIRWLIAHEPQELFVRTARAFSEELAKQCGDELEIEILTYNDYAKNYGEIEGLRSMQKYRADSEEEYEKGVDAFWNALYNSTIEMSQIQVYRVGCLDPDFLALDLPFLFEDHDHVQRVVEGPIGQSLCENLGKKTGVTGLAFTYSGGYRVVGSHKPIATLDELAKMKIAVTGSKLSLGSTIESMGGECVGVHGGLWHKHDPMVEEDCDAIETTYLRFDDVNGKHILKTNHSMFMTTIVVSNQFWNTLTESQQEAFRKAGLAASRKERNWSVEDAITFEEQAQERGVTIVNLSAEDQSLLKKKSQINYVNSKYLFSDGLVKAIREQK